MTPDNPLLWAIAIFLIVFGSGGLIALATSSFRDRRSVAVTTEKITRLEMIDLLQQDPREWIAEGEARALAEWAEENPAPAPEPRAVESAPSPARQAGKAAPRCPECSWEPLYVLEQPEPISWALVDRCEPHDLEHAARISASTTAERDPELYRALERVWDGMRAVLR